MSWLGEGCVDVSGDAVVVSYSGGSVVVKGVRVPGSVWDERVRGYRAQGMRYGEIINYLRESGLVFVDQALNLVPCPMLRSNVVLRSYQEQALARWVSAGRRGVVVLPTGSGKTEVAIKAIEVVNQPTLVVVPTIDLMEQWRRRLRDSLGVEVGAQGGGYSETQAVTVATYDTAYLKAAELGNRFGFIVFDEVHHLASQGFRSIAEIYLAECRLGLTATLERPDMLHLDIPKLVGDTVYRLEPEHLAGRYLSEYTLEKVTVKLSPQEKAEYESNYSVYRRYLARHRMRLRTPRDFQRLVIRSGRDPEARRALLARNRAMSVAFNSQSKIDALEKILAENPSERILVFTQHNELVYRISRRFLIPFVTHTTPKEERAEVLSKFRSGVYRVIVTSKVLDEGIDVPDASLGVIVSGTGSSREFVQRLGRILRKSEGKQTARLIEIVSAETSETNTSQRRNTRPTPAVSGSTFRGGADMDESADPETSF